VIYLLLIIHLIHLSKKKSRIELSDTPLSEGFFDDYAVPIFFASRLANIIIF